MLPGVGQIPVKVKFEEIPYTLVYIELFEFFDLHCRVQLLSLTISLSKSRGTGFF